MENANQEVNIPTNTPQPSVPGSKKNLTLILILLVVISIIILLGAGTYLTLSKQKSNGNQSPFSINTQKQIPVKGCGNKLCEEGETFDSCPSDCQLPSSIEPSVAKLGISKEDLPPPPSGKQWSKFLDHYTIDGSYVPFPIREYKLLLGKQNSIRAAVLTSDVPSGEISYDDLARFDQYIFVYPQESLDNVFAKTSPSALSSLPIQVEELPDPKLGDRSRALKFSPAGKTGYTIVFIKRGYFQIIALSGTEFEYKVLEDIARKAADKIQ